MAIRIYIDQGHNPQNPNAGAEGNGYREQDLVYRVGVILRDLLLETGEFDVRLSRPSPETQLGTSVSSSLAARVSEANRWGANYFISLHANASVSPNAAGTEAYVYAIPSEGYTLALAIVSGITARTGLRDRGVFARPSLYVLRKTRMPAVLCELAFITNPTEAELLASDPRAFAEGIRNGLLTYFGLV